MGEYKGEAKTYTREHSGKFDKEHDDMLKKLLDLYPAKDRKKDFKAHHKAKKAALEFIDKEDDLVEEIEHMDHVEDALAKILHSYDKGRTEHYNKERIKSGKAPMPVIEYDEEVYLPRVQHFLDFYRDKYQKSDSDILGMIKEGNIGDLADALFSTEVANKIGTKARLAMRKELPPNKDPEYYLKLAHAWAAYSGADLDAGEIAKLASSRDTLLNNGIMESYRHKVQSDAKKLEPKKKKPK